MYGTLATAIRQLTLSLIVFAGCSANSADFYIPVLAPPWKTVISAVNRSESAASISAVFLEEGTAAPREQRWEVGGRESRAWTLSGENHSPATLLLRFVNSESQNLQWDLEYRTPTGILISKVPWSQVHQRWDFLTITDHPSLQIRSLGDQPDTLQLVGRDEIGKELSRQKIAVTKSYQSLSLRLPLKRTTPQKIQWNLEGFANRYLVFLTSDSSLQDATVGTAQKISPSTGGTYFLAGPAHYGLQNPDSLVIRLVDPRLIEIARKTVENPLTNKKVIIGRLTRSHGGYNRVFTQKGSPTLSWNLSEVLDLADFASIDCDTSPSILEDFLPLFLNQPRVCFWNLSILRELSTTEVATGHLGVP